MKRRRGQQVTGSGVELPMVDWSAEFVPAVDPVLPGSDSEDDASIASAVTAKPTPAPAMAPVSGALPSVPTAAETSAAVDPVGLWETADPDPEDTGGLAHALLDPASGPDTDAEADAETSTTAGKHVAPGRSMSMPVAATAAVAGVVLIGVSLAVARLGSGGGHHPVRPASAAGTAGFPQSGPSTGFVPDQSGVTSPGVGPLTPQTGTSSPLGQVGPSSSSTSAGVLAVGGTRTGTNTGTGTGGQTSKSGLLLGAGAGATGQPTTTGAPAGAPTSTGGPATLPTTSAAPAATYTGIAGRSCTGAGISFQLWGWFAQGQSGFLSHSSGGVSSGGCSGSWSSMPMSGSASADDNTLSIVWAFHTGAVASGTCRVSVYIPNSTDIEYVGGDPSYYTVQNSSSRYPSGTEGSFSIKQVVSRGQWVSVGSYPVSGGLIAVMLHSRGVDFGNSGPTYAHHAADAVQVSCTA